MILIDRAEFPNWPGSAILQGLSHHLAPTARLHKMLTESFIAASSSAPTLTAANASQVKDAGIFVHTLQPQPSLRSTFKKSTTAPNCIAISDTHIYAAQKDKASIHVYNREKGNQEATVPFPERIESVALTCNGMLLVAGTAGGRLMLWDTTSGRILSTSAAHLQSVNVLAADDGQFVLSGSGDASILVWSLIDLLSFPTEANRKDSSDARTSLSGHSGPITALATGSSASPANIAVSAARDHTVIVWDYVSGTKLRTILLEASAICIGLDVADRGVYCGYEDGSVQRVDFYTCTAASSQLRTQDSATAPLRPSPTSRWPYITAEKPASEPSALCLAVSYDGTRLLSGHSNGTVNQWDVQNGQFSGTLATYPNAPMTSLHMLPVAGFRPQCPPKMSQVQVSKPRPHEEYSRTSGGHMSEAFAFNVALPLSRKSAASEASPDVSLAMHTTGFPAEMINAASLELAEAIAASGGSNGDRSDSAAPLNGDASADFLPISDPRSEAAEDFEARLAQLRDVLGAKDAVIERLQKDRNELAARERETLQRRANRANRRENRNTKSWRAKATNGHPKSSKGDRAVTSETNMDDEDNLGQESDVMSLTDSSN